MSEQQGPGPLPELTPDQEAEVRRLLSEARHQEPIPDEVAARLDGVLAGLSRDEPGSPGVAPVIDLAARRRRRNAAALLAGAAAVVVAGFAIGQGLDVGSDDANDAAGSSAVADRSASSGAADKQDATRSPQETGVAPQAEAAVPLRLTSQHLARDLEEQLGRAGATGAVGGQHYADLAVEGCPDPLPPAKFGLGDLFPALYNGTPAVLALRPPADGSQQADVLDCTTAEQLDSATLTAP